MSADEAWRTARSLIRQFGWNTTCGQLLNPGLDLWVSSDRSAVVGFMVEKGIRVVAGAPVCALEKLDATIAEFEGADRRPACYFGAEERLYGLMAGRADRSFVVLGGQPMWHPEAFLASFREHASLRAQLARARHKGVTVREVLRVDGSVRDGVARVLSEWLESRGLPPLHFLVEPNTIDSLADRRLFVAEREGQVVAFSVLSPIPARNGYLTEQFVRGREAPNGSVELVLFEAVKAVSRSGASYLTMGIVPLSPHVDHHRHANPRWLDVAVRWARAHGRRFYNFAGLDGFKAKFLPEQWDPVYVIAPEPTFRPRTLLAVASAFTNGHPVRALLGGLGRAAKTEVSWLLRGR